MNFTVVWMPDAEKRLAQLWLASRLRHAIRESADRIDIALGHDPNQCGESRGAGLRVMLDWPLGVLFEVDEHNRQVRVLSVWRF